MPVSKKYEKITTEIVRSKEEAMDNNNNIGSMNPQQFSQNMPQNTPQNTQMNMGRYRTAEDAAGGGAKTA